MEEDSGGHAVEECLTGDAKDMTERRDDLRSIRKKSPGADSSVDAAYQVGGLGSRLCLVVCICREGG